MFTILALAFVLLLVILIFYGFSIVVRKPPATYDLLTETCTLCGRTLDKHQLVERQVGDSKLYYFCAECIDKLQRDAHQVPQ